jgi:hypothetical protein
MSYMYNIRGFPARLVAAKVADSYGLLGKTLLCDHFQGRANSVEQHAPHRSVVA